MNLIVAKINKILMVFKHKQKQSKEEHAMKALFGSIIISTLLFASCSTSYYASAPYEDDIYYSSSSSGTNIRVTEDNSNNQTPKYIEDRETSSNEYRNYTTGDNRLRKTESNRFGIQEYIRVDTIYKGDSIIYIEEIVEEEPYDDYAYNDYSFDYTTRIHTFHRPSWRYNYYGYYDPFYYSYYGGNPYYYNDFYWDYGWSFNYGLYSSWGWPYNNYYHHPYYQNYWGYSNYRYGNSALNHYNSNNNSRYYGHRNNKGRNSHSYSQIPRASRSLNSSTLKRGSTSSPAVSPRRPDRTVRSTKTTSLQSQKKTDRTVYSTKRGNVDRKQIYSKPGTSSRSQGKTVVRYRKPRTYTSPTSRSTGTSKEYQVPRTNQKNAKTRTIRRVVTSPNRSKNYSTPSRGSSKSYSTPIRSKSQQYRSPSRSSGSKSYSTPTRSTRSRGSGSKSYSSPSRSSSSGTRSSGGSSRSSGGSSSSGSRGKR